MTQQDAYAQAIVARVVERNLPFKAAVIAVETAMTESSILMYANGNNPRSMQLPHDAVGWDHGSVGLFQQQVGGAYNSTANWGTTDELMNVSISTDKFLAALSRYDYMGMSTWNAAQSVQGSFDPSGGNYRINEAQAIQIVNRYWAASHSVKGVETMNVVVAAGLGLASIVDGGKYHLAPGEWSAIDQIRKANPSAVTTTTLSAAQWNSLVEKRGQI